jgi:CheY-like chemotaxis protein
MPELDGVSMAIEIRNNLPEVAILLFSGQATTADLLHRAEQKGFHFELLQKPIHPDQLVRKVAAMLAAAGGSCPGADCATPDTTPTHPTVSNL